MKYGEIYKYLKDIVVNLMEDSDLKTTRDDLLSIVCSKSSWQYGSLTACWAGILKSPALVAYVITQAKRGAE